MEKERGIHGIKVSRIAPAVSHLLYADDILIACRADEENAKAVNRCLEKYCGWSGQRMNPEKSHVLFLRNTSSKIRRAIGDALDVKQMMEGEVYLGNTLVFSRNKKKDFGKLRERLQARLEGWQSQLLSRAGKATLIRSVAQAMPVYSMSTFKIPKGVCAEMDKVVRKFWWGGKVASKRYLAYKSWRSMCKPKGSGGLGFKYFEDINLALLAKLGWKIAAGEDNLWTRIFKAKYMRGKSFFECETKPGDSMVWRGILSTSKLLRKGSCYSIGDGWDIKVWHDPWIPELERKIPRPDGNGANRSITRVAELLIPGSSCWDEEEVRCKLPRVAAEAILKISLPQGPCRDKLIWRGTTSGRFSVRSCFDMLREDA